jgi:serpin B
MKHNRLTWLLVTLAVGVWRGEAWADTGTPQQDVATVAASNNTFAVKLYGQLDTGSGNLFFSPYSINSALAMTYDGARGRTDKQMARVLDFSLGRSRLNAAFSTLSNDLDSAGTVNGQQVFDLAVANSLWGQTGFSFNPQFIQTLQQDYGADLNLEDFGGNAAQATDDINQWVAQKTANKIQDLFANPLPSNTKLVLVNAIYFLGNWEYPFDKSLTTDEPFHVDAETNVTASMMQETEALGYMENSQVQVAEFPYIGNELSMVVVLPKSTDGLATIEGELNADRLSRWLGSLTYTEVIANLPKFQLGSEFQLAPVLQTMGMKDAFSIGADFSGMGAGLCISQVVHKAFVNVNETGTEAAAASGVVMVDAIAGGLLNPPVVFTADHPFLFLIRDRVSGAILFMGRVEDPTAQ